VIVPTYVESKKQEQERTKNFVYHAPKPGQAERYTHIRDTAGAFAKMVNEQCPPSRELSVGITLLEQAVFWFNAAIARNE